MVDNQQPTAEITHLLQNQQQQSDIQQLWTVISLTTTRLLDGAMVA
jgi:hypothetical protein